MFIESSGLNVQTYIESKAKVLKGLEEINKYDASLFCVDILIKTNPVLN